MVTCANHLVLFSEQIRLIGGQHGNDLKVTGRRVDEVIDS